MVRRTSNANAPCPFDRGRCVTGDDAAYEMDTGPIDSHFGLGINAPRADRVTFRKKTTCAPLNSTDVGRIENVTIADTAVADDQFYRYYYGPLEGLSNFTYEYYPRAVFANVGYGLKYVI